MRAAELLNLAECEETLAGTKTIRVEEQGDDILWIHIDPAPDRTLWISLGMVIGGLGGGSVGMWLFLKSTAPGSMFLDRQGAILMLLCGMCAVFGAMLPLIRMVQGPPKGARISIDSEMISADRALAGDMGTISLAFDQIEGFVVEAGQLQAIHDRNSDIIVTLASEKLAKALAGFVAARCWGEDSVATQSRSQLISLVPYSRITRHYFVRIMDAQAPASADASDPAALEKPA